MSRLGVAILGATGMVGQIYVRMLSAHPWFEIKAVTGNSTVGKTLREAYRGKGHVPEKYADLEVLPSDPSKIDADLIFSCLPTKSSREVEPKFAAAGFPVVSDSSAHRYWPDVPLIIPEVNPEHLDLIDVQRKRRGWDGYIVTTPNCTTVGFALPLKPLVDDFGLKYVNIVTMQAISGAGYNGVPSMAILGNIIPYIDGEEPKVAEEPRKILGTLTNGEVKPLDVEIDATCMRVPTVVGHLEAVHVELGRDASVEEVMDSMAGFTGLPQKLELPTAPRRPIQVFVDDERPQPRIDAEAGDVPGMVVYTGRVRKGRRPGTVMFVTLSHNLIRGAAGSAILTAELLYALRRLR
ncbi:MAG: aspartate-semialdehyde dehydrogenase [Nitrososphaerota archaeon]|nr:aspartate-semialdehyde dehydrogenase [Candidatus Calditenuaceae archaeon]MDW8074077.1 aspartate-semialdehyde dehydrogenase [Nitrososphaerota archaeon]